MTIHWIVDGGLEEQLVLLLTWVEVVVVVSVSDMASSSVEVVYNVVEVSDSVWVEGE